MGLTGGFADIGGLYDCLYGIYAGLADDSILNNYSDVRRKIYQDVIDPISSSNLQRLWDPEKIEEDDFIRMLKRAETDKEFARGFSKVCPDCTDTVVVAPDQLIDFAIGRVSRPSCMTLRSITRGRRNIVDAE